MSPAAAERSAGLSVFVQSYQAFFDKLLAPMGDPISPPTPIAKPEPKVAAPAPTVAPGVIARCGYASIVSELDKDGETPIFRATFDPGMVDEMIGGGCAQFYQGCNVCVVRYEGCDEATKAACKDPACLEKACERSVVCSAKACEARGKPGGNAPTCKSRLVRTACSRKLFK